MAKARPFTYNNGSPIGGTAQLGNLAIGVASLDYSRRPGNKTWWMGPDEENQYVIIKDVPTQDWPTPIGNIGSIRFWNSNQKTDSAFISMTNDLPARNGQTAFTTVRECTDWLSTNGYWSNYPVTNEPFSTFTVIRYPASVAANGETGSFFQRYNPTTDTLYVSPAMQNPEEVGPVIIENINNYTSGSNTKIDGTNDYLPARDGLGNQDSGYGFFDLDITNNKMYMLGGGNFIIKYNLTNNTIDSYAENQVHSNYRAEGVYDSNTDQFITVDNTRLRFYDGDDLSLNYEFRFTASAIADNDELANAYKIALDTTNNRICTAGREKFAILNPSNYNLIHTGSWDLNTPPGNIWNNDYNINNGIYNPTEGKYYFGAAGGDGYPTLIIIDDTTYNVEYVKLKQIQGISLEVDSNIAYDSDRNAIWAMDGRRNLIAVDCSTNTVVVQTTETLEGNENCIMNTIANDKLYIGSSNLPPSTGLLKSYDVNKYWPI